LGALIRKTSLLRDRSNSARGQRHQQNAAQHHPWQNEPFRARTAGMTQTASGVRELPSACADGRLGPISSSRCQTTRNIRMMRTVAKLISSGRTSTVAHSTACANRPDNNEWHSHRCGGARRDRTDDLMLAKHALSQLSYGPFRHQERFEPFPGTGLLTCSTAAC
jgi:hypothetical protein